VWKQLSIYSYKYFSTNHFWVEEKKLCFVLTKASVKMASFCEIFVRFKILQNKQNFTWLHFCAEEEINLTSPARCLQSFHSKSIGYRQSGWDWSHGSRVRLMNMIILLNFFLKCNCALVPYNACFYFYWYFG